jgi:dihydropteroate synthase
MGIINATPDSFYDGNFEFNIDNLLKKCEKHLNEGADIIDVGGESTRPGSLKITEAEELNRVVPVIKAIKKEFKNIIVSVDSTKFNVVKAALEEGADIINDISGLNFDESLADLAREYYAGLVLMHIQKQPENMQENPNYSNLMNDIIDFLDNSIEKALSNGVNLESVVIDPGIGFGKTVEHNTEIINRLNELKTFNRPILMGVSNKSFIGKILNLNIDERVLPTAVCNSISLTKGSSIFRVHNVLETKLSLKLTKQILDSNIKK